MVEPLCRLSVPKPYIGEGCLCSSLLSSWRSRLETTSCRLKSLKVLLYSTINPTCADRLEQFVHPLIFEMPVPSSSKLRPGYSLNFRHPAADEAAARFPGFTLHIGLGEWNNFLPLDCTIPNATLVLTNRQRASFFTSCSYFSPQRECPISPST
jgi:hypothetical protein